MKIHYIFLMALFLISKVEAQQEAQNSQFMYNKLAYNPAYAGSDNQIMLNLIYRNQWLGFDGAPQQQILSFNMPSKTARLGFGANIAHYSIGLESRFAVDGIYAYRIKLENASLGFGLQASLKQRRIDFLSSKAVAIQSVGLDPALYTDDQSTKLLPNFGFGVYYNSEKVYFGVSVPRLLKNVLNYNSDKTTETYHGYGMLGFNIKMSDKWLFQPQTLVKYAMNAPFTMDLNVSATYAGKFMLGATFRTGETTRANALACMIGLQLSRNLLFGASYDANLSELKSTNAGSLEGVLRYIITRSSKGEFDNPRIF